MGDGDIKDAASDMCTTLQPSLPEQFAIEKVLAELKRPRSIACRMVIVGLTSGTTMWNTVDLGRCFVSLRQIGKVVQGYFAP